MPPIAMFGTFMGAGANYELAGRLLLGREMVPCIWAIDERIEA